MESDIEDIYLPLEGFNHGAQLVAIYGLLYRQELAEQDLSNRIEEANAVARRTTGRANDDATDYWVELAQMSCYQEAAHSMAAVSMIAPLIESTFRAAFRSIGDQLPQRHLAANIVKHVEKLSMTDYLPADLQPTLEALFKYRNEMFHGGFEWAPENLKAFEKELDQNHWPTEWFSKATSDDEPWIFYMTPTFIDHCLKIAEAVVRGVKKFTFERTFNS